jgi:hypothetical protein
VRHIGSFLLSIIFAPAIFLLTGAGLSAFGSTLSIGAKNPVLTAAAALGALLLAGLLYGILIMVRLSPIGPFLAGLGFLLASSWVLIDLTSYQQLFDLVQIDRAGSVGEQGLGFLLAVPLIATVFSPRRWRRYDTAEAQPGTYAPPAHAQQPGYPPGYPQQQYGQQAYRSAPDATRQMPAQPTMNDQTFTGLPDVAPPSLGYPKAGPLPTVALPPSPPPSPPPLPRRADQPQSAPQIHQAAAPPQPAQPAEPTTQLQASEPTTQLTPPRPPKPTEPPPYAQLTVPVPPVAPAPPAVSAPPMPPAPVAPPTPPVASAPPVVSVPAAAPPTAPVVPELPMPATEETIQLSADDPDRTQSV